MMAEGVKVDRDVDGHLKKEPGNRLLWAMLYAALTVIAFVQQGAPRRDPGARPPSGRADTQGADRRTVPAAYGLRTNEAAVQEHGRGRHATVPWRIPSRGWKDILWRTYQKINDNRLLAVAAGVVFYVLLALFPAIAAFVSLFGLVADPSTIDSSLSAVSGILPGGAVDILHQEITRLTAARGTGLSFGFVFGLLIALWSAMSGMKAIIDALNVAYDEKEKRSFIRLNLAAFVFTLGAILSLILSIGAVVVAPIVLGHLGLATPIVILRWPILLALVIIALAVLYRYAPSRTEPRWEWLSVGSAFAGTAWLVASGLFSWYIANFGTYNVTYGSLGAAVGMMMWMWISMIVVLLGAELNAEIEHQTARDSTAFGDMPLGRRGAVKADTIGAAQG